LYLLCPSVLLLNRTGLVPGHKISVLEPDHCTRSSAEVKNGRSYSPTPPICDHDVHRDSCNFLSLLYCCNLQANWKPFAAVSITMPTRCIYSYNGDGSEGNWLIAVPGL
jgi:hypothetical protein